jgi:hypothetical protein
MVLISSQRRCSPSILFRCSFAFGRSYIQKPASNESYPRSVNTPKLPHKALLPKKLSSKQVTYHKFLIPLPIPVLEIFDINLRIGAKNEPPIVKKRTSYSAKNEPSMSIRQGYRKGKKRTTSIYLYCVPAPPVVV